MTEYNLLQTSFRVELKFLELFAIVLYEMKLTYRIFLRLVF